MEVKFILPDEIKSKITADEAKTLEAMGNELGKQIASQVGKQVDVDAIRTKIINDLKDQGISKDALDKFDEILRTQGADITGLKENPATEKSVSLKSQLEAEMSKESFKEAIAGNRSMSFTIKADPTTIMSGNFADAPHALRYEVEPGINKPATEDNVILPLLNKGGTNSPTIRWINRSYPNGEAAFIGEGVLKPYVDWTYAEEVSTAKKVADSTKVSTEMLQDFDYMESEIRDVLRSLVEDKIDEQLLTGDGTGANLTGILTNASAYVGTGLDGTVTSANLVDAIRASVLQLRQLQQKPNVVLLNPADKARLDLLKNTLGNYIAPETRALLASLNIIETMAIDEGKLVVLDTSKFKVRMYKEITLTFGWENDDFRRNLVTAICEARMHSYHNSIDDAAILYDEIANITGALQAA